MIITDYAVVKLQRDPQTRQWTILGQCNDIPGECRPSRIYPIVAMVNPETGTIDRVPRAHAQGWIDPAERFGYVKMNFWKRAGAEEVTAVMTLTVEVHTVRCVQCKAPLHFYGPEYEDDHCPKCRAQS